MSRINNKQKEILVDFMSTNYNTLYGKFAKRNGKDLKQLLWTRLMERLNEAGPPQKSVDLWKRSWSDFKMETKKKVQKIRQHRNRTGGGPACSVVLSEFEETIISIIGDFCADGDSDLTEIGFDSSNDSFVNDVNHNVIQMHNNQRLNSVISQQQANTETTGGVFTQQNVNLSVFSGAVSDRSTVNRSKPTILTSAQTEPALKQAHPNTLENQVAHMKQQRTVLPSINRQTNSKSKTALKGNFTMKNPNAGGFVSSQNSSKNVLQSSIKGKSIQKTPCNSVAAKQNDIELQASEVRAVDVNMNAIGNDYIHSNQLKIPNAGALSNDPLNNNMHLVVNRQEENQRNNVQTQLKRVHPNQITHANLDGKMLSPVKENNNNSIDDEEIEEPTIKKVKKKPANCNIKVPISSTNANVNQAMALQTETNNLLKHIISQNNKDMQLQTEMNNLLKHIVLQNNKEIQLLFQILKK